MNKSELGIHSITWPLVVHFWRYNWMITSYQRPFAKMIWSCDVFSVKKKLSKCVWTTIAKEDEFSAFLPGVFIQRRGPRDPKKDAKKGGNYYSSNENKIVAIVNIHLLTWTSFPSSLTVSHTERANLTWLPFQIMCRGHKWLWDRCSFPKLSFLLERYLSWPSLKG